MSLNKSAGLLGLLRVRILNMMNLDSPIKPTLFLLALVCKTNNLEAEGGAVLTGRPCKEVQLESFTFLASVAIMSFEYVVENYGKIVR